jgi:hypothetical protein
MKTQDLRIDNYLEFKGKIVQVDWIDKYDNIGHNHNSNPLKMYNPIPLTEEWLLKLGGVPNPYQDRYEFGKIHVHIDKTKGITDIWIDDAPHIKYVHQFQNYVHAKTGEELTIKN